MLFSTFAVLTLVPVFHTAYAQKFGIECNNFNSSAAITPAQASAAGIDSTTADNIAIALNFERSNYAFGSVDEDPFYRVPLDSANAKAGTILKVEAVTNVSAYTLPPNTALSRILFQSADINGSVVPGSAFIQWPYLARRQPDGWPIVAWAHGDGGIFGNCAPSHRRDLLYEFGAPFTLALQGYVVVAPDFTGLGVDRDASGKPIVHPVFASPVLANDLFYAVQAAQSAFPQLSKEFVVMGHSEGGGAAWGAAQRQAIKPVAGHLGTIAGSPVTRLLDLAAVAGAAVDPSILELAAGLSTIFPDFQSSDLLTSAGEKIVAFDAEIQGCNAVGTALAGISGLVKPDWFDNFYVQAWQNLTVNGGKRIAGPLLVLQGEADPSIPFPLTTAGVQRTCQAFPKSRLEYVSFANVTHVDLMFASQRVWLDWIEDRFADRPVAVGCRTSRLESARPYQDYLVERNWYLEYVTQPYEIA